MGHTFFVTAGIVIVAILLLLTAVKLARETKIEIDKAKDFPLVEVFKFCVFVVLGISALAVIISGHSGATYAPKDTTLHAVPATIDLQEAESKKTAINVRRKQRQQRKKQESKEAFDEEINRGYQDMERFREKIMNRGDEND